MYKKVSTDLHFAAREKEVLRFWKDNDIFAKSSRMREGGPTFTFYDGPPTANGKPHIGHVLTRSFKDVVPRYRTMKGYHVLRKAGWDTHGLPVELEVEKLLGIDGKPQIEAYGVEPFIQQCKKSVWKYLSQWQEMSERVGFWVDMEHPYITYDNNYIESVWWSLKQLWDKGLIYKGHKIVPYCPRCGTALSSHEVAQGYKDVTDVTAIARFRLKGEENTSILAWTTTPWTLPSNVALCVNARETYVRARLKGEVFILAEALVARVLGEGAEILSRCKGSDLEGTEYVPLYDFADVSGKKAWFVVCDDYVTLEEGTGVVHIAPAFGEDDSRVGQKYDLPLVQLVDTQGQFVAGCGDLSGLFVKDADAVILKDLEVRGLLFAAEPHEHAYPFCWRCDTPLIYYARQSWFIRMTALRDELVKNNRSINWMPDNIKEGRMGNFLENVVDWGLSRERYWGTPLPIWECACGHRHMVGSIKELRELGRDVPEDIELHKPYIDQVHLTCPDCGGEMQRVSEVIDCWYDSGSMPFAQWHYPFENQSIFKENYPADFISEAVDQTRGWFYTLLAISTAVFGQAPFKNCIVLGHVNDKDGQKMSKHKGNVVDPWTILDKQGADAVRWYFFTVSSPWLPSRFYAEAVSEAQRKYMGTLWNTYAFYILYADIDAFDPTKHTLDKENLPLLDRWILSRLNELVRFVDTSMEDYKITEAARALSDFVDELSNWYVRRGRERYWAGAMAQDKVNAFMTLYTVLETLTRLTAPFTPFMAEEMYQNLVRTVDKDAPESVHMCDFPVCDESMIDPDMCRQMEGVLDVVVLGRAARNAAGMKIRQPLSHMLLCGVALDETYTDLVADELNVKKVSVVQDLSDLIVYTFKPQLRTLGPRFGKRLGAVRKALAEADAAAAMAAWDKGEAYMLDVEGTPEAIAKEDVLVETGQKEGFVTQADGGVTVALDITLTDALRDEGLVREVISKVQTQRRASNFNVTDRIVLHYEGDEALCQVIEENASWIAGEVLAVLIERGVGDDAQAWDINGHALKLSLRVQA
nr:isoleucine--tRNA ligase [Maliibacterium massiliense]